MKKRIGAWLVILPCLVVFSVVLIGNAFAGSTSVEEAAQEVSEQQPEGVTIVYDLSFSGDDGDDEGEGDDEGDDLDDWKDWLLGRTKQVCRVSESSAAVIGSIYRTKWITVGEFRILVVHDASSDRLREILGDAQKECRFVRVRRTFFLPFDPHIS